jgi:peptidoglycan hydrolase CwlO-like protein
MKRLAILVLLFATPALAQQQSASVTALQINTAVSQLALELEQAQQVIPALQKQIADEKAKSKGLQDELDKANAKFKELESKPDAKKE